MQIKPPFLILLTLILILFFWKFLIKSTAITLKVCTPKFGLVCVYKLPVLTTELANFSYNLMGCTFFYYNFESVNIECLVSLINHDNFLLNCSIG